MSTKQYRRIRKAAAKAIEALEARMLLASVEGFKFNDLDRDGVWEAAEPGLAGWTIYADLDADGVLDTGEPSTLTGTDGSYALTLPDGSYLIEELPQAGWMSTAPRGGRLFSVRAASGGITPMLLELDSKTGATLRETALPGNASWWGDGLAFNGSSVFYLPSIQSTTLYEIDPDTGAVIDVDAIPASPTGYYLGVAAIGTQVYVASDNGLVRVFDSVSDTVVRTIDVNAANGGNVSFGGPLAALRGPAQLVGWDLSTYEFLVIDAETGMLLRRFGHGHKMNNDTEMVPSGLAVVDGEIHSIWASATWFMDVYAQDGTFRRTMTPAGNGQWGLGGDDVVRVIRLTAAAPAATDVNFGAVRTDGEIRGVKFHDRDGDGVRDVGEEGLAGWTMFLDGDGDGELDAGERTAVTDANGEYVFGGLLPGDYVVDEVQQPGWRRTNRYPGRLFASQYGPWITAIGAPMQDIAELDPATLAPTRAIALPGGETMTFGDGLAFNGTRVFHLNYTQTAGEARTLYELDAETGAILDSDVLPGNTYVGLAVLGTTVYAMTSMWGTVVVFDTVTDTVVRTMDIPAINGNKWSFSNSLTALRAPGRLVGYDTTNRQFVEVDADTGLLVRRFGSGRANEFPYGLAAAGDKVYVAWYRNTLTEIEVYGADRTLERTVTRRPDQYTWALGGDDAPRITTVAPGQSVTEVDFANQQSGVIRGVKYHDRNGNGARNAGEEGLAGWTMFIDSDADGELDAGEPSTVTDASGSYQFVDLPIGNYLVEEIPQSGWVRTQPAGGRLFSVQAGPKLMELDAKTGAVISQVNLPDSPGWWGDGLAFNGTSIFYVPATNSTKLYEIDPSTGTVLNQMSIPSGDYTGVAGMGTDVYLLDATNYSVVTVDAKTGTVTRTVNVGAANGQEVWFGFSLAALRGPAQLVGYDLNHQRFAVIDPATGVVQRTFGTGYLADNGQPAVPTGLAVVGEEIFAQWHTQTSFIDVYRLDGTFVRKMTTGYQWGLGGDDVSRVVPLTAASPIATADFGASGPGRVSGTKFNDRNGNGVRDTGEEGLAGWTIYLDADGDSVLDPAEPRTITDDNGEYVIDGVLSGNYVLDEIPQAGWRQTNQAEVIYSIDYFAPWAGGNPAQGFHKINPTTGALTGWIPLPPGAPALNWYSESLAYNGFDLYYVPGGGSTKLYRLDPQTGAVRGEFTLPAGNYQGAAAIGDTVYISRFGSGSGASTILAVNGITGVVERTMTTTMPYNGLAALRNPGTLVTFDWYLKSIVELDPQTLTPRSSFKLDFGDNDTLFDLGAANGSIYVNWHHPNSVDTFDVFSRDGSRHWTLPLPPPTFRNGLGGDDVRMPVQVVSGSDLSSKDLGGQRMVGDITGVIYQDDNRNGVQDAGEAPLSGWIAYLDVDRDHEWNGSEPFAITGGDGTYRLSGIDADDYVVEVHPVLGLRQTTPSGRMFALAADGTNSIVELNATTGAEIRRFASPVAFDAMRNGLAFDGVDLYMFALVPGHQLYRINPDTGAVTRTFLMPAGNFDGLAVLGDKLYLQDSLADNILVVNKASGALEATLDIDVLNGGTMISGGLAAVHGPDALIAAANSWSQIVEIDPVTGLITRQYQLEEPVTGIAAADGGIWFGTDTTTPIRFRSRDGVLLRQGRPLGYGITALGGDDNGRTVRVTLNGTASASFGFAWDSDVADAMAAAGAVTLDQTMGQVAAGSIGDGPFGDRDVDLYQFTASIHDQLALSATGGVVVRLLDFTGVQIGSANQGTWRLSYNGRYYIGISGNSNETYDARMGNSGIAGATGDYALSASLVPHLPTVTINQAATQPDPTLASSAQFLVVFSDPVTGFDETDVLLSGTAGATTTVVAQTGPMDGTTYLVAVTGMTRQGTVIATVRAGAGMDEATHLTAPSTSTDNSVYFDVLPGVSSFRVNDGVAQRSMVKKLTVTFTEPVTLNSALALRLHSGASVANVTMNVANPSGDGMTYVMTFSGLAVVGGSLPDGIYDFVLTGSAATDATGNAVADNRIWTFHRLFGDSDGNRIVNSLDYARLKHTFGRAPADPLFNSAFDYEGNGLINALDLARFRQRYGLSYSY